jgi:hypothetical protein
MIDALTKLLETSNNDKTRRAATYACNGHTYTKLFNLIEKPLHGEANNPSSYSDYVKEQDEILQER